MIDKHDRLYKDFEVVNQIPIISTMLEVICSVTGLGYAAIARVTQDRWLACAVLDSVNFGLGAGDELKIETTICNEIRDSEQAVIIDHVDADELYKNHHTPKMYGLQSYISFPIILKNGNFFGTLCAIGSKPAILNTPQIIGTFTLFSELISFHLQSLELMERSHSALLHSRHQNLQYRQISQHNLKEPLRKIQMFSDILINETVASDVQKAQHTAVKINTLSKELASMIQEVSTFSELTISSEPFEEVDLNNIFQMVYEQLEPVFAEKKISVSIEPLPIITAMPFQMKQFFFNLLNYITTLPKKDQPSDFIIYSKNIEADKIEDPLLKGKHFNFTQLVIEHRGISMMGNTLKKLFDIFIHLNDEQTTAKYGPGLANCKTIVHNHGGVITTQNTTELVLSLSIILPKNYSI